MGSSAIFGGLIAGFGEQASKRNETLMTQEIARRKELVLLYKSIYENEKVPREIREKALQFMTEIPQFGYDKKLPKQYWDSTELVNVRPHLQPPSEAGVTDPSLAAPAAGAAPVSGALGAPPPAPGPGAPEGLVGSATGEAREAGVEYAPPGPGFAEPAPAPAPAAPAPGGGLPAMGGPGELTPEQLIEVDRIQKTGAAATAINVANQYKRANIPPPGITPLAPVEAGPQTTVIPRGPGGELLTEDQFTTPAGVPTGEGPGSFDAYARAALTANGYDPNNPNDRPEERNKVVLQARREYERPPSGVYLPLMNAFGEIIGFYNAQTGMSKGPPPTGDLPPPPVPGEGVSGGAPAPGAPGAAGQPPRRAGVPTAERKQKSAMEVMMQDVDRLRWFAQRHPEAIGAVMGRAYSAGRMFVDIDPEVNRMFRIAENLSELLLRARSGAQINEAEYNRLRKIMPNPAGTESKFWTDLAEYQLEGSRLYAKQFGTAYQPLKILDDGSVWEQQPDGTMMMLEEAGAANVPPPVIQ